ncbi:MAG: peptidylprolyl isomerase [Candidatus Brocadia sp. WS118]|nr:MAG: peptidylprolyl isomerase [Candidatus Brocadia sp. WS118]
MKKFTGILAITLFCIIQSVWASSSNPRIRLETNKGIIILEFETEAAPKTVENFLRYVQDGFYHGTIFHRVIKGFMVQGGGLTADMREKPARDPIVNEADNGLKNRRGTVAMARTMDPHSATAQFFINTVDNPFLDHKEKTTKGWGYCVFGRVVEGMNIVDTIENLPTTTKAGHQDVPASPVIIEQANVDTISANK